MVLDSKFNHGEPLFWCRGWCIAMRWRIAGNKLNAFKIACVKHTLRDLNMPLMNGVERAAQYAQRIHTSCSVMMDESACQTSPIFPPLMISSAWAAHCSAFFCDWE